jgi:phosphinothricin acetyltransferase
MPATGFRVARAEDAAAIAAIYAPYVRGTIISFETEAPDDAEMRQRIERIGAQYPWLIATLDERVVGYAYACEHRARLAYRWSVDAAVYLHASVQRRGIGRALYERLFAMLRQQGYVNAFAGISLPNAASVGMHEALGFRPIGTYRQVGYKLGAWRDVGWWQLKLCEPPGDAPEPVAFPQLDPGVVARILD